MRIRGTTQTFNLPPTPVIAEEIFGDDSLVGPSINSNNPGSITIQTTGNIDNLDFGNANSIRMNNASLATIRGLKAGYDSQRVKIISVGSGQVDLAHQNGGSSAVNQLFNVATSANTSLSPNSGVSEYTYDATTARWRLTNHEQGAFILPVFSAGDFTGSSSMTWTVTAGEVQDLRYRLSGRLLTVGVRIVGTTVGGTLSNQLLINNTQWGSFTTAAVDMRTFINTLDNGVQTSGFAVANTGSNTKIQIFKDGAASNWSASVNTTVIGIAIFEVN